MRIFTLADLVAYLMDMYPKSRHPVEEKVIPLTVREFLLLVTQDRPEWVLLKVPTDLIQYGGCHRNLAEEYARLETPLPPGIGFVHRRYADSDCYIAVYDGYHRAKAAELRGETHYRIFVPLEEYDLLINSSHKEQIDVQAGWEIPPGPAEWQTPHARATVDDLYMRAQ